MNLFLQSFDAVTDLSALFNVVGASTIESTPARVRTGAHSLKTTFSAGNIGTVLSLPANAAKLTVGFGYQCTGGFGSVQQVRFSVGNVIQVGFGLNAGTGAYQVYLGGDYTKAGSTVFDSTALCNLNVYDYIELQVTFGVVGSVELRVNGFTAYKNTAVNTAAAGVNYANQLVIDGPATAGGINFAWLDDLYLNDGTGAANNSFMNPVRVYPIFPSADAAPLQFSPSTAGAHFNKVNAATSQQATYVQDPTVGDVDQYVYSSAGLPAGTLATALQLNFYAALDTPGSRQVTAEVRSGASTVDMPTPATLSGTGYKYFHWNWDLDPITGLPLSNSSIDANTFGPKVTA